jgi:hypothetical protein
MVHKREGPAPQETTPGPKQGGDSPASLPQRKSPRNTSKGHTSPNQNRRVRRRPDDPSWRQFNVRVVTGPDSDAVHALHAYLCAVARRYGLTIAEIDEVYDREKDR